MRFSSHLQFRLLPLIVLVHPLGALLALLLGLAFLRGILIRVRVRALVEGGVLRRGRKYKRIQHINVMRGKVSFAFVLLYELRSSHLAGGLTSEEVSQYKYFTSWKKGSLKGSASAIASPLAPPFFFSAPFLPLVGAASMKKSSSPSFPPFSARTKASSFVWR